MNKIYRKNEVRFAIICILIYVIGTIATEAGAEALGVIKLPSAVFHAGMTLVLLLWLKKNGLFEKYGLIRPGYRLSKAWFFIPIMLIACSSIFFGVTLKYSIPETAFYIISMLCVGFLEEVIFRGFLFLGMAKNNLKSAIIVSSVTFGIGHIVNLLNGQDLLETLLQIVFAISVGFVLVTIFYKGKSLLPCIVFHGVNNALSAVSDEQASLRAFGSVEKEMFLSVGISIIICVVYAIILWRNFHVGEERKEYARA